MKNNLLLLAFCLLAGHGFSQQPDPLRVAKTVDSLLTAVDTLMKNGKNEDALLLAQQASALSKQVWGVQNARYAGSLNRMALSYARLGQDSLAEKTYLQAIDLREKVLGKAHPDYIQSLFGLAVLYHNLGDYAKAEPLYLQSIDLRAKVSGKEDKDYALALQNLAYLYTSLGEYAKAEALSLEGIDILTKKSGKENPQYATALKGLAILYFNEGEYVKAENLLLEAKDIEAKTLGKEDPGYASTLDNLSGIYSETGDYAKAEPLILEALAIRAKTLGKEDPDYALSLNNLATMYYFEGNYAKAEPLFLQAIPISTKALGRESPHCLLSLNGLAALYYDKGDYAKAEPLFLEIINIRAKVLGKEHPEYAGALANLANLYTSKGDFTKAEQLYRQAIAVQAKSSRKHPDYAQYLTSLAGLYYIQGNFVQAEPLYIEAKKIYAAILGQEDQQYADALTGLALLYLDKGDYAQSEPLFLEAIGIEKKAWSQGHPILAASLNNLAQLYLKKGDYAQAEPLMLEAQKMRINLLGKEHPDYVSSLQTLATLYQQTNRLSLAKTSFLEANALNHRLIEKSAAYSSESQMLAYLNTFSGQIDQFQSFAQSQLNSDLAGTVFDNALFFNGFLLENARRLSYAVTKADSVTQETYNNWQAARRRLANEYAKPTAERINVAETEAEAEGYEKTLIRRLPAFSQAQQVPHWQQVRDHLPPGSTAVEFVHYRYYKPQVTDSVMYAALVLRPGAAQPMLIPLFEEKELLPLLRGATGGSNFMKINTLYSPKTAGSKQKSLYELIWQPLEGPLQGVNTLYCSPTGLLHRLNLATIPDGQGKVFGDGRQLVLLGSTRQLASPNAGAQKMINTAYLAGGIRYESDSTAVAVANQGTASRSFYPTDAPEFQPDSSSNTRSGVLDYLPSTSTEVSEIGQMLKTAKISARVDTGFYATEDAFRHLGVDGPSPRVIHLATHGYFFPDPKASSTNGIPGSEPVFKMSEHPMIRSGLILAGAKQAWLTGKHPQNQEDGILTAYEISQMNLSNTELVVLSACETGLGDIEGNEGVYGLQRAFKIAGAKYLIMSLWKVDDRSTKDFMAAFYGQWLTQKLPIPQAFRAAQQAMRLKHPSAYDWAGFILIE